jgi:putative transposase
VKPAQQRERVGFLTEHFGVGTRRACRVIKFNRATQYYKSKRNAFNEALLHRIKSIAAVRVRYGYRRIHVFLRREGYAVNHKRVYRLYAEEGLNLRIKTPRRRKAAVARTARRVPTRANEVWAMDFMHERLADHRKIRLLTIVDLFTRECVALDVAYGFKSADVVRILAAVCKQRGTPEFIRCDNGTEFVAEALDQWAYWNRVELDFSRPGKPTDNAFAESFNGRVRAEFLNPNYFETLAEARRAAGIWRYDYNEIRPHSTLGNRTPKEFALAALDRLVS